MTEKHLNSKPLIISLSNSTEDSIPKPLRNLVKQALQNYFLQLQGQDTNSLYELVLEEVEQPLFETVMQHTKGNQTKAAQLMGINRCTLRKKLKKYQIN